jgi:hypothetical protein
MKCAINLIGFQRFDEGTKPILLGKPKFVTLTDALYSRKSHELWKTVCGFDIRLVFEKISEKLIFGYFSIYHELMEI